MKMAPKHLGIGRKLLPVYILPSFGQFFPVMDSLSQFFPGFSHRPGKNQFFPGNCQPCLAH